MRLLYDDEDSKAVGINGSEIVAYDLGEALEMKREFDRRMYDLANTIC